MSQKGDFVGLCMAWATRCTFLGRQVNSTHLEGSQVNVDPLT